MLRLIGTHRLQYIKHQKETCNQSVTIRRHSNSASKTSNDLDTHQIEKNTRLQEVS